MNRGNSRLLSQKEALKLKTDMMRKHMGRLEVSEYLGVSYNSMGQWLNGFQAMPLDKLQALKRLIDLGEIPNA